MLLLLFLLSLFPSLLLNLLGLLLDEHLISLIGLQLLNLIDNKLHLFILSKMAGADVVMICPQSDKFLLVLALIVVASATSNASVALEFC
jgi:hypothetical protein